MRRRHSTECHFTHSYISFSVLNPPLPLSPFDITQVRSANYDIARAFALFGGDVEDASNGAIGTDVGLLPVGYILLVIYSSIALSSGNPVRSYASMGVISFASVGLAILGMLGMGLTFQVPYNLVIQASFFLLAGLGVDDSFVIMAAHQRTPLSWSPARRLSNALARAGVSILFTTVTDIAAFASGVSASVGRLSCLEWGRESNGHFAILRLQEAAMPVVIHPDYSTLVPPCASSAGTSSSLPAIKFFCVYTLIGVIVDFGMS